MADRWTSAPISGRLAASCTRCSRAGRPSIAKPSPTRWRRSWSASPTGRCSRRRRPRASAVSCGDVWRRMSARRLRDIGDACLELDEAIGRFGSRSFPGRFFDVLREWRWAGLVGIIALSAMVLGGLLWRAWGGRPGARRTLAAVVHAGHVSIGTRVVPESVGGWPMGGVRRRCRRQSRHLSPEHDRPDPHQSHGRLDRR